jgi:hypothetical protein
MQTEEQRRFLSPTARRIIRSYGILILIAVAFLLIALFVHEVPKTVPAQGLGL